MTTETETGHTEQVEVTVDTASAHLLEVDAQLEWSLRCGCLDSDNPEDPASDVAWSRPCAVREVCSQCSSLDHSQMDLADDDGSGGFVAHGRYHRVETDGSGGLVTTVALNDVCGLGAFLLDGSTGWLAGLVEQRGPGMYLVYPDVDEQGRMYGRDAVGVVR